MTSVLPEQGKRLTAPNQHIRSSRRKSRRFSGVFQAAHFCNIETKFIFTSISERKVSCLISSLSLRLDVTIIKASKERKDHECLKINENVGSGGLIFPALLCFSAFGIQILTVSSCLETYSCDSKRVGF